MAGKSKRYSVVVVGAGAFGLSTALHLLRRGTPPTEVLLIDRQSFPSVDAASNDTSRAVRLDYTGDFYGQLAKKVIREWKTNPIFKPHFHETGRLHAALPGDDHGQPCRQVLSRLRASVQDLEGTAGNGTLAKKFSGLDGQMAGWDLYYTPEGGWAHPRNALLAAMKEYLSLGGTFIGGSDSGEVVENVIQDGKICGVQARNGGVYTAEKVVYAIGAFASERLLPGLNTQIHPVGFALAHWRLTDKAEIERWRNHPVVDLHHHGYFFPPDENGLMKMGTGIMGFGHGEGQRKVEHGAPRILSGVATARANSNLEASSHSDKGKIPLMAENGIRWILQQMAPSLAEKPFFDMKVCWDGMTPDGGWIIDEHPAVNGLYVAIGGSGHGFKFLPLAGDWIVESLRLDESRKKLSNSDLVEMRAKWKWGRPQNMEAWDPSVVLQGRPLVDVELAMREVGPSRPLKARL